MTFTTRRYQTKCDKQETPTTPLPLNTYRMISIKKASLRNLFASWLGKEDRVHANILSSKQNQGRKIASFESGLHERVRTEGVIFYVKM